MNSLDKTMFFFKTVKSTITNTITTMLFSFCHPSKANMGIWSKTWNHQSVSVQKQEQTALHTQTNDKTDQPGGRDKNCCCQAVIMRWIQSLCTPMFSQVETGSAHRYSIKQCFCHVCTCICLCVWNHSRSLAGKPSVCILFASQHASCLSKWLHAGPIALLCDNLSFYVMLRDAAGRAESFRFLPLPIYKSM